MLAKLRYSFDNWISWRASARFVLVLGLGIFALVFGATLLKVLAPESDSGTSFLESLWWSWGRVADPGSGAGDVGRGVRVAEVLTTLSGLFLFALLIGFVSSGVEEKLGELRKGRSIVVEKGHVLILGFSEKALRIVAQIAEANLHHPDFCVVILSMQEKEAVMDEVLARFGGPKVGTTRIVVRNGEPWSPADLKNVGASDARSVVLLAEDGVTDDGDVRVVKALLALTRALDRPLSGHVVAELHDSAHRDVVEAVGGDRIEIVVAQAFLARLLVQTARQRGLARVYADLLSFEGDELYLMAVPDALVGKTFGDAWASLPMAVVAGVEPKTPRPGQHGSVILAPPDDTTLERGDQLLVLVPDDTTALVPARMKAEATLPERSREPAPHPPERFLIVGFEEDLGDMLEEIDQFVAPGSEVVVMTSLEPDECARRLAPSVRRLSKLTPRFVQGDSTSLHDLEAHCEGGFDAEILIADESEPRAPDDADARTLMTLLLLRKIAQKTGRVATQRLISEIRNPRTKELATVAEIGDFVVSDELVSDFLAQVAERREIADVWSHLRQDGGHEIFLKPAWRYAKAGERPTFADVTARARARGEIALGYTEKGEVVLNPKKKAAPLALGDDDRIVVISDRED